jgi:hypothetical protein
MHMTQGCCFLLPARTETLSPLGKFLIRLLPSTQPYIAISSAGDENLKFWKIWEIPKKTAVRKREEESRRTSVSKAIR